MSMRILLADRDSDSLDVTAYALRREGFQVVTATTGADALRRWETDHPQVILLEAGLHGPTGFEVCRVVREKGDTPVIFLSDRADDDHVVHGFRVGADDYVSKPFSPRQLVMRIHAVWRRRSAVGGGASEPERDLTVGSLTLDVNSHEVRRLNRVVRLTPTEFRLLHIMALNAGRVVTSGRLVEYAWGYDETDAVLLKTHICHIRRKLRLPRGLPGDIASVPRVGYRLTLETVAKTAPSQEKLATPRPIQLHPEDMARGLHAAWSPEPLHVA
jgi:DNA-binding response OmpR family regulator